MFDIETYNSDIEQKFDEKFWLMVKKISINDKSRSYDFEWGNQESGLPIARKRLKDVCQDQNNSLVIHF